MIPTTNNTTTAHTSATIGDGTGSNSTNILSEAVAALETIRLIVLKFYIIIEIKICVLPFSQAAGNPQAALAAIRAIIERGDAFGGHIFGSGPPPSDTHKRWRQMFSQEEFLSNSSNNNSGNIGDK